MATAIVEGFSLSHAQVLDGATTFLNALAAVAPAAQDVYGVNEATLDPDTGDYDNEGDDAVLSAWSWFNFADVNVQAGYLSFPLIAALTAQTVSSSGAGAAQVFGLELWHEDSMNVAPKPMVVRMPSRDSAGVVRSLAIGLYKVNFKPITFDGPSFKDGLKVNYQGRAVQTTTDETGTVFADGKKHCAKILSFA